MVGLNMTHRISSITNRMAGLSHFRHRKPDGGTLAQRSAGRPAQAAHS
jgi:hypothetical protein